jgi:hypothetical protein
MRRVEAWASEGVLLVYLPAENTMAVNSKKSAKMAGFFMVRFLYRPGQACTV